MGNEAEILAENLFGHAIDTPEIASVGNGDAQVSEGTSQPVQYGRVRQGQHDGWPDGIVRVSLSQDGNDGMRHRQIVRKEKQETVTIS